MKINEPVTNNEVVMNEGEFIVSTTDLKGRITSVNRVFTRISGFNTDELIGKSHNIVRHPDMPPEAFEDLWRTIKAGRPWTGMVKNRCKNGDFYWVKANVTPLREHGRITGYMSVRVKPTRMEIEAAETLYRDVRAGRASLKPGVSQRLKQAFLDQGVGRFAAMLTLLSLASMGTVGWLAVAGASLPLLASVIGAFTLVLALGAWGLTRYVKRPVQQAIESLQQFASGEFFHWPENRRNDDLGRMLQQLKSAQIRLGYEITETTQAQSCDFARIREALESASAKVMILDEDLNIIYLNKAAGKLLKEAEADIRKELPGFDADRVLGGTMDQFRDPAQPQQEDVLGRLEKTFVGEFPLGGHFFRVTANPVFGKSGERLGVVLEWDDRTAEVAIEKEIQSIVDAASMGNLGERIEMAGKKGFFATLSRSVNELVSVLEKVIDETSAVIGALARGDLNKKIETEYEGSFARLRDDVNATVSNLSRVIDNIRKGVGTVEHTAREIAEGNADLARRTETQSSSLEETAASMEEITSTVRQNADNSRKASELSKETLEEAVTGGSVVTETIGAMEKITESSKKIASIIGVIDDIAFQTNLLALNAAVEAARAGEQGRGFAVVATEVRNLAQRSATAAKEIKDLIEDSVSKVEEGSELVNQSGRTLREIVESVKQVNDFIAEIAAASSEQYSGIDQVNQAVSQIEELTQRNSALVEKTAQSSQMLDDEAKKLGALIAFFKIGETNREGWDGTERRSSNRPWASRQPAAPASLDFSAARTKHKLWKTRLRAFLDGEGGMSESEAVSHHDCDLGKWLYGKGLERYGHLPEMQRLEKTHAEMHALIKQVIQAKRGGDLQKAETVFARVERYSDQVSELLTRIEQQVSGGPQGGAAADGTSVPHLKAVGEEEVWEEF